MIIFARIFKFMKASGIRPLNANVPTILFRLTKPIISLSVAFSALTAWFMHQKLLGGDWFIMYLGVLLTAAASSTINQIQEAPADKLMNRTSSRPIPSGQISPEGALIWAALLAFAGISLLWIFLNPLSAVLAIITLLWYNAVYTPLKKITPWAIIPGAMVGAIPPVIGWTAAGGAITDIRIIILSLFFFTGQIPHFWLILLRHDDDYEKGGFPTIKQYFNTLQIARLTFAWTFATTAMAVCLPMFGIVSTGFLIAALYLISVGILLLFIWWMNTKIQYNIVFMAMNMWFFLVMVIIIIDALI
jgi:heme o synthase